MHATATARSSTAVDLTVNGTTYTDVPVSTWPEGGYGNMPTCTAAQIEWTLVPDDHPVHAIVDELTMDEIEALDGAIADAMVEYHATR